MKLFNVNKIHFLTDTLIAESRTLGKKSNTKEKKLGNLNRKETLHDSNLQKFTKAELINIVNKSYFPKLTNRKQRLKKWMKR